MDVAVIALFAKLAIAYTEYTTSESNLGGEILRLRYKNDITMIYNSSRILIGDITLFL